MYPVLADTVNTIWYHLFKEIESKENISECDLSDETSPISFKDVSHYRKYDIIIAWIITEIN